MNVRGPSVRIGIAAAILASATVAFAADAVPDTVAGPAATPETPAVVRPDSTLTVTAPSLAYAAPFGGVSPTAAVVMTPVFPGWGQLHAGGGWRAVVAFAYETWFVSRALMFERKAVRFRQRIDGLDPEALSRQYDAYVNDYYDLMRDNWWWTGGAIFISAIDAYVGAHLNDFDRDPVPVPEGWDPAEVPQPIELPPRTPGGMVLLSWSASF